ncbi:MAG: NHL repeat-containing protein [Acidobacteriota bacterium]
MRRILLAVLILALPTAVAVGVYLFVNKSIPTDREAVGNATTIAGTGYPGVEDGPVTSASFNDPFGVAVDRRGNVIVADGGQSNRIRRIRVDGRVETIAGSTEGFADGDAMRAQFNTPSGIAIDKNGNLIIADTSNNRVRKLSSDGRSVSTIAGSGVAGFKDGPATEAEFDGPIGIATDRHGNIFVADTYNDCIRRISTDGQVTTIAGTGAPGYGDGQAASASFDTPSGIAIDGRGDIFVADTGNHAVRKITELGEVTTVAGRTEADDAHGNEVRLNNPVGISVTHDGFLFISDEGSSRIIRIAPDGARNSYAGSSPGYADGVEGHARMNGPTGIAIDRKGVLHVADSQNYLVRQISPTPAPLMADQETGLFLQPSDENTAIKPDAVLPKLSVAALGLVQRFPWPLNSQHSWHEVSGVVGEARGAPRGIALDHLHSGLDIRGSAGEAALSVHSEKVSSPIANWDFEGSGEGIRVGLFSYIHVRIGRSANGEIQAPEKFKPRTGSAGELAGVRVRRGTRFRVGDLIGSLNRLNHVHLNLGPWNAQANPLELPFVEFKDTVAPTIEKIEIVAPGALLASVSGKEGSAPSTGQHDRRLLISGDVAIVVTAYDLVDGNAANRKLGLYRIGYQLLNADGAPVKGFEQPLMNIEFNRLPPDDSSVLKVYALGSGVSAYGTPTKFRYIVTNRVRDGEARNGLLRTSNLPSGDYVVKVIAEDYAGNRASGKVAELPVTVRN